MKKDDEERARNLLQNQYLAVLCTQGENGPYASLMAYAYCRETDSVYMITKIGSEKHRNIMRSPRVALLIDDRCQGSGENDPVIPALTVQGTVRANKQDRMQDIRRTLGQRFPPLLPLVNKPDSAVLCIELDRFLLLEGPEKAVKGTFRDDV